MAIFVQDPSQADEFDHPQQSRRGCVTSGTAAVLGLGNIGPLAAKPVMEGKAALFKKFAVSTSSTSKSPKSDPDQLDRDDRPLSSRPSGPSISRTSKRRSAFRRAALARTDEDSRLS